MKPTLAAEPEQRQQDQLCTIGNRNSAAMTEEDDAEHRQRDTGPAAAPDSARDRARSAPASAKISDRHEARTVLRRATAAAIRPGTAASPCS